MRAGVGSVMSAYNSVNGQWCSQNRRLLTDILKEKWGFDGFVVSDWVFGVHDGPAAVRAGLDLEMPSPVMLGKRLLRAVKRGRVPMERVDDAALRLIRQQLRVAELGDGKYGPEVIACKKHRALAREVATKAIVLLRNEPVEPRARRGRRAAARRRRRRAARPARAAQARAAPQGRGAEAAGGHRAVGRLPNLGDRGSSGVNPPSSVTPLEGLRAALKPKKVEVVYDDGSDAARAAALAAGCDAAVVVVGYDHDDEGENLDTGLPWWLIRRLPLPPRWALSRMAKRLLKQQLRARRLRQGRRPQVAHPARPGRRPAAGRDGGQPAHGGRGGGRQRGAHGALAPGGAGHPHAVVPGHGGRPRPGRHRAGQREAHRPAAVRHTHQRGHLPPFDNKAKVVEYGPLHGQALLDHLGVEVAFPFGFGLTYADK